MIGIVLVSHSEALATAARDLALEMVRGDLPPIRIAAGAAGGFGTDAVAIAGAIDELADTDGVLVLVDLGSAVLSSSLALELRESAQPVIVSDGPFVEGTMAAIVGAAAGSTLAQVAADASIALRAKQPEAAATPEPAASNPAGSAAGEETLINPLGIHARTAALIVRAAAGFDAAIELTNDTEGRGPVSASSLVGLLSLGASGGHRLRIEARGEDASDALASIRQLIRDGLGEVS